MEFTLAQYKGCTISDLGALQGSPVFDAQKYRWQALADLAAILRHALGTEGAIMLLDYCVRRPEHPTPLDALGFMTALRPSSIPELSAIGSGLEEIRARALGDPRYWLYVVRYLLIDELLHKVPVTVMNYGYLETRSEFQIPESALKPEERPFRLGLQLYRSLVSSLHLDRQAVLEVGSGNGGGAAWLSRYFRPALYLGIDPCFRHIPFCKSYFNEPGLEFRVGSAENLPVANNAFDVVLSVEAAHAFPDLKQFAKEARRVLKPEGMLCLGVFFPAGDFAEWQSFFLAEGFRLCAAENITTAVEQGLLLYLPELVALKDRLVNPREQAVYERIISTRSFNRPESNWHGRSLEYWRFQWQKE